MTREFFFSTDCTQDQKSFEPTTVDDGNFIGLGTAEGCAQSSAGGKRLSPVGMGSMNIYNSAVM